MGRQLCSVKRLPLLQGERWWSRLAMEMLSRIPSCKVGAYSVCAQLHWGRTGEAALLERTLSSIYVACVYSLTA